MNRFRRMIQNVPSVKEVISLGYKLEESKLKSLIREIEGEARKAIVVFKNEKKYEVKMQTRFILVNVYGRRFGMNNLYK